MPKLMICLLCQTFWSEDWLGVVLPASDTEEGVWIPMPLPSETRLSCTQQETSLLQPCWWTSKYKCFSYHGEPFNWLLALYMDFAQVFISGNAFVAPTWSGASWSRARLASNSRTDVISTKPDYEPPTWLDNEPHITLQT